MGTKGRMNPPFHSMWQYIRAIVIAKVWQDRNQVAHHKPGLNLDQNMIKGFIQEACTLAKEKKKIKVQASILLRKLSKL